MKKYTRLVASFLAMLMLVGVLPLADLMADEVETTDTEVVAEEAVVEDESEEETEVIDETIPEESADEDITEEEVIDEETVAVTEEIVEISDEETTEETEITEDAVEEIAPEEEEVLPEEDLADAGVAGFIDRIYSIALNRTPDASGRNYWIGQIRKGKTGADVARYFLFSPEFLNKNMSDSEFLDVLYRTFFDRAADASGKQYFINKMNSGWTKQQVINSFINSTEWANICLDYGIASGGAGVANKTVIPGPAISAFVNRLYTICLGRDADPDGYQYYARRLANHQMTGTEAAYAFMFSQEMIDSNISNAEFVRRLYRACYGRDADEGGFTYWNNKISNGAFREDLFNSFVTADEWKALCVDSRVLIGKPITVRHLADTTSFAVRCQWINPTDRGSHYVNQTSVSVRLSNVPSARYYYRVYQDDEVIYTSPVVTGATCDVVIDADHGASLNIDGYIESGIYYVVPYTIDGTRCVSVALTIESFDVGTYWYDKTNTFFSVVTGWGWAYARSGEGYNWNNADNAGAIIRTSAAKISYLIHTSCSNYQDAASATGTSTVYYRVYRFNNVGALEDGTTNPPAANLVTTATAALFRDADDTLYYNVSMPHALQRGFYLVVVARTEAEYNSGNYLCYARSYITDNAMS